ncbi:hypothetical protein [Clostridium sp. ZS2-4]|uniref:hypothetical protein n=1 Tax=Clostridium sp. ZS2-4 TaxID=2987703 RepID=UPI00227D6FCE|nr:hypothetical protein [Clostridium sp. ZS2-4]MCY6355721.1 hypothetical protein [Clostridium sp. ZS2-4]
MFFNTYPLFNRGRILKLEMLEQLRDFPRDFIDIVLSQYSDGIILGCDIKVNGDYIVISKGLIKHEDVMYMIKEDHSIPYRHTNDLAILKIRFLGETKNSDFIRYSTEIFIDENLEIQSDEMELCRFKVKMGAKLRGNYINFQDMSTEYDTVNIINSPFAAYEKSSLSPEILRNFAKEAFQYNLTNALDISFCMMCLQSPKVIERELILNYIAARLKILLRDYSNQQIYGHLVRILEDIKEGREILGSHGRIGYKKILVD